MILAAEARRLSRRPQFHGVRVGYAAGLSVVVMALGAAVAFRGTIDGSDMGRFLFLQFRDFQILVTALIGPFVAAVTAVEEREEGALPLLVLSRPQISCLPLRLGRR